MIRLPDARPESGTRDGGPARAPRGTAVAPTPSMRSLVVCLILCSAPARAAELVLAGRIDRVVAAGDLVAVVRDGEVRVLSGDGRPVLRLGVGAPEPEPARRDEPVEEDLFERNDGTEELGQTIPDDEAPPRRAPASVDASTRAPLLAASATELWIAAGLSLWRVEADGRAHRAATLGQRFDHLAAAPGGRLLAAQGAHLWQSLDGLSFEWLADADGPVRAVAAGDGVLAWATARQLTRIEDGRLATHPLASLRDLRACGSTLLALDARGLVSVGEETLVRPAGRESRRVACRGETWVLVGRHLLVSSDEGDRFAERADLPPVVLLDAAVDARGLWLASDAGLYRLPADEGPPALIGRPEQATWTVPLPRWTPYLPRLTVAASAVRGPGRDDLRALAYADFPLAAPPRPPLPSRRLAQLVSEPAPPPAVRLPPDRESSCLTIAREEAVARALVEPERARSYVSRAGHAAWLPELRVLLYRRLGRSESLDLPAGASVAPGPLGLDTANDVRYEARATWDLSKLVFSTEEIAAVNAALRMADLRREVESLANRLYFERRRLKMEPVLSPSADTRARRDLRVEELEAELDALSGGAFTRCLPAPP
jgi:hypothetical protein